MALFANGKCWGFIYLCLIVRETTRKYEHKVYLQDIIVLLFRTVLYHFTVHLSYCFYRASINRKLFLVQNYMDHLLYSAGVWQELVHFSGHVYQILLPDNWTLFIERQDHMTC